MRGGLHFDDRVTVEQRELRHQRRREQRDFRAQLVLELRAP